MQPKTASPSRLSTLIDTNIRWLQQAARLVTGLNESVYASSRAGAHVRHIVEFYQCFLKGVDLFHIDYDSRERDEATEQNPAVALSAIRSIMRELQTSPALQLEAVIWVRMEDAGAAAVREPFMESSISRELQVLSSHTVHHFAIIAMTLRMHGVEVDPSFGVAPSTLRYMTARAEAA